MDKQQTTKRMKFEHPTNLTRRDFVKNIAIAGGAVLIGNFGLLNISCSNSAGTSRPTYSMLFVDYDKCTGCRTCEAICAIFNHPCQENGEPVPGIGNPYYSNIRVYHYNPDVDVPNVCAMCPDSPCIGACPVSPDPATGKSALFRDGKTGAIKNDLDRCLGCGSCADACRSEGAGVIVSNPKSNRPERMCTLCDGSPKCVEHCPYGALRFDECPPNYQPSSMLPDRIAPKLIHRYYRI